MAMGGGAMGGYAMGGYFISISPGGFKPHWAINRSQVLGGGLR